MRCVRSCTLELLQHLCLHLNTALVNTLSHSTCPVPASGKSESPKVDASAPQQPSVDDLKDNPHWAAYKASLDRLGYFQGNIPGSAQHKQLLAQALQSFVQNEAFTQSAADAAAPGEAISAILQQPIDAAFIQVCLSKSFQTYNNSCALFVRMLCRVYNPLQHTC